MSELSELLADAVSEPYVAKHNVSLLLPAQVWSWLTGQVNEIQLKPAAPRLRRHTIPTYLGHVMTLYQTMHDRPHRFWPLPVKQYIRDVPFSDFERRQVRLNLTPANSEWWETCGHDFQSAAPSGYHCNSRNSALAAIVLWAYMLDTASAARRNSPLVEGTQTSIEV